MASIECMKSGCERSTKDGHIIYTCSECNFCMCTKHASKGNRCPKCRKGFLN